MVYNCLCGNGKTTWTKTIQSLILALNIKNPYNTLIYGMPLFNSKEFIMRSKDEYNEWRNLMRTPPADSR